MTTKSLFTVLHRKWREYKMQLFCQRYRLPTEAEWEYAARGGNKSKGYEYSGSNDIGEVAWYDSNSGSKTHAVGGKKLKELGIYDMSGNVYEWCHDWYGDYSSSSQTNPKGVSSGSYRVYCSATCQVAEIRKQVSNLFYLPSCGNKKTS